MNQYSRISQKPVHGARGTMGRDFGRTISAIFIAGAVLPCGVSIARGQNPTPSPPEITTLEQEAGTPSDADKAKDREKNDQTKPKKEKRGSIIVAPIPISSPAFGSGLLLITAYVFKLDENDKTSPPSWLGAAGVFTSNGTR